MRGGRAVGEERAFSRRRSEAESSYQAIPSTNTCSKRFHPKGMYVRMSSASIISAGGWWCYAQDIER